MLNHIIDTCARSPCRSIAIGMFKNLFLDSLVDTRRQPQAKTAFTGLIIEMSTVVPTASKPRGTLLNFSRTISAYGRIPEDPKESRAGPLSVLLKRQIISTNSCGLIVSMRL